MGKKVLINFLYWGEKESGLYRVGYEIITNLIKLAKEEIIILANENFLRERLQNVILIEFKVPKNKFLYLIFLQIIIKRAIKKYKPNLIFSPFHVGYFLKTKIPQIIMIHDLIHLTLFKKRLSTFIYHKFLLKKLINNSKIILTVSNSAKIDLINIFKLNEEKIKVIKNSASEIFQKLNIPKENFYLAVNPSFPYKNIEFLIEAWNRFKINDKLIIIGTRSVYLKYYHTLRKLVKEKLLEDKIIFKDKVSDEELVELYNKAKALISPSLKEGFNLPPLEALACGTPILLSDIPVHREIYGDIAIFFDVNKPESFLEALKKLDNLDQEEFEEKRQEFVKNFSWENSAKEVYGLIKEILENSC